MVFVCSDVIGTYEKSIPLRSLPAPWNPKAIPLGRLCGEITVISAFSACPVESEGYSTGASLR